MKVSKLTLLPFSPYGSPSEIGISCVTDRDENILALSYELLGAAEVVIPSPSEIPARKNALWEETCFEFFLGVAGSPRYWEFNLSPAGHWNVFRFEACREGMQEEMAFASLPFSIQSRPNSLVLFLEFDLLKIIPEAEPLEAAISAVIKHRNGAVTYWALAHQGTQPDFHRRDSFIVKL